MFLFFFQAEDGIRDLVRSRGLGDVYKRQAGCREAKGSQQKLLIPTGILRAARMCTIDKTLKINYALIIQHIHGATSFARRRERRIGISSCLLYTSDAADERSSVDLGGRRIIKTKHKKKKEKSQSI